MRYRFDGEIYGFGTGSGHRIVIGRWLVSPFGPVADVMMEDPDGVRRLIAPRPEVARFIADTYDFDEVRTERVEVSAAGQGVAVRAGPLEAEITVGGRSALGVLLRLVPDRVATSAAWATVIDPIARVALPGVRTRGRSRDGRREWYGAHDVRRLVAATATWEEGGLGAMTDVFPPVRFGFGSTPRRPSLVRVTTTIRTGAMR